ncbi:ATP-binding protein [Paludifilum halophilum]|uniref:histidine kinase n=1 Tax=Paludifilum halophilum TaxID=1642702 RepID=A0A235B3U4_9BACL|nr:ATP-binding protein [Paludifilum halophilum]OYD06305.1 hypothetical protein CHM34_17245 [Paludifilum halophilum]
MPIAFHLDMELDQLTSWVERMPQAVMIADDRGRVVTANELLLRMLQRSEEEVLGQSYSSFVALPEQVDDYLLHTEKYEDPLQSVQGTLLLRHSPPQPAAIQVISGKSRGSWYHLLLFTPAPKYLSLLQQYAETLITDINLGILVLDEWGNIVEINKAACRLFGVIRKRVLNRKLIDLFERIRQDEKVPLLAERVHGGDYFRNFSTSWVVGDRRYQVLVDFQPLQDGLGGTVGTYLVIKDVTQLHSLEMQIRRTDRLAMIGQIAAGTAHEIRNPLTSIRGFLQVMKHSLKEKGEMKEQGYTEIMLREIDRINALVSEFLLLSKPRSVRMHPIRVEEVLGELLPIIENEAILHNTEVRYRKEGDSFPRVVADAELLKQVFLNLCKNGIEAMGDGGLLTIRQTFLHEEGVLAVEIQDRGPGIPDDVLKRIFDPFFTTKENGTGLGLSVCQRIVHDIGGNIRVSTKDLGAAFSVLLPGMQE